MMSLFFIVNSLLEHVFYKIFEVSYVYPRKDHEDLGERYLDWCEQLLVQYDGNHHEDEEVDENSTQFPQYFLILDNPYYLIHLHLHLLLQVVVVLLYPHVLVYHVYFHQIHQSDQLSSLGQLSTQQQAT